MKHSCLHSQIRTFKLLVNAATSSVLGFESNLRPIASMMFSASEVNRKMKLRLKICLTLNPASSSPSLILLPSYLIKLKPVIADKTVCKVITLINALQCYMYHKGCHRAAATMVPRLNCLSPLGAFINLSPSVFNVYLLSGD